MQNADLYSANDHNIHLLKESKTENMDGAELVRKCAFYLVRLHP